MPVTRQEPRRSVLRCNQFRPSAKCERFLLQFFFRPFPTSTRFKAYNSSHILTVECTIPKIDLHIRGRSFSFEGFPLFSPPSWEIPLEEGSRISTVYPLLYLHDLDQLNSSQ
ncbi:hypothetical protein H112_00468 [Trichophyton rubrum D6]|uniref:Uncharacterized protein n=2 Tax=Trichophyton TaxID=5550 RepID=A0A022WG06_TRIRU|nr:hypothetical protein H100_00467 [Trichophyton rubrum MR850]EZF46591.1 hypothetical protein H102_00467 [Trichophyton rubrum CBS 100081]EZF57234.1 hypothetical protein H103_00467 [Trichophyton rubrum CBS 288.86]EZF67839.1 hypothetical protein H104_00457 [Trichophyton rubrum CBS 289.86]EZF78542.1 hypothetical protein H105_00455 [Trichophyton soudanense CBS 452.61]EZF89180.1 hypothetical protein H110_00471 [Trichophyton rubrum MR1448]EZF99971.1 hypothetical protein H113_00472 [Trichophyton rub